MDLDLQALGGVHARGRLQLGSYVYIYIYIYIYIHP